MTVEQLQARLRALHAGIGDEGCLSLTLDQEPDGTCYVSHWSRPGRYQPERWHAIGVGPLGDCLAAAERYADAHHRRQRRRDDARRAAAAATKGYAPAEGAEAELIAAE